MRLLQRAQVRPPILHIRDTTVTLQPKQGRAIVREPGRGGLAGFNPHRGPQAVPWLLSAERRGPAELRRHRHRGCREARRGRDPACQQPIKAVVSIDRNMTAQAGARERQYPDDLPMRVTTLSGLPCDPSDVHDALSSVSTSSDGPWANSTLRVHVLHSGSMRFSFAYDPASNMIELPALCFGKSIEAGEGEE